jgi:hypothetical protein
MTGFPETPMPAGVPERVLPSISTAGLAQDHDQVGNNVGIDHRSGCRTRAGGEVAMFMRLERYDLYWPESLENLKFVSGTLVRPASPSTWSPAAPSGTKRGRHWGANSPRCHGRYPPKSATAA